MESPAKLTIPPPAAPSPPAQPATLKLIPPNGQTTFVISEEPKWPAMEFTTNIEKAVHVWKWRITWLRFHKSGQVTTPDNCWDAATVLAGTGGLLTVHVSAGTSKASASVHLKGTNPTSGAVVQYLKTQSNSVGFDKILQQESKMTHFNHLGQPKRSFDNGYGMAQLTMPAPTFEQCWDWKKNVDGGLVLFASKQRSAKTYLTQSNRTFTTDQLAHETVSRWNGGAYHIWDAKAGVWTRNPDIVCDAATGNIGWNMQDPKNAGKTEAELHKRDSGQYRGGKKAGEDWTYSGVCYADRILD